MPRIIVNPEQLRQLSTQLLQIAEQLRNIDGRLTNSYNNIEFEVQERGQIDGEVMQARSRANELIGLSDSLARRITGKVQAFEEADREGAAGLPAAPPPMTLDGAGADPNAGGQQAGVQGAGSPGGSTVIVDQPSAGAASADGSSDAGGADSIAGGPADQAAPGAEAASADGAPGDGAAAPVE
ncbi:MAG TPA: hypothetical protein VFG99_04610, partial [Chloroflexia bacterium]|nr:hypothetical protein [Chloroflexia bacterium]